MHRTHSPWWSGYAVWFLWSHTPLQFGWRRLLRLGVLHLCSSRVSWIWQAKRRRKEDLLVDLSCYVTHDKRVIIPQLKAIPGRCLPSDVLRIPRDALSTCCCARNHLEVVIFSQLPHYGTDMARGNVFNPRNNQLLRWAVNIVGDPFGAVSGSV